MKMKISGASRDDEKYEKQAAIDKNSKQELERQQREMLDRKLEAQKKAHKQRLERERIQMLKMKQGIAVESPLVTEKADVPKPKMTGKQKFSNFWYQHSMYIILAVIVLIVGVFLVINIFNKDTPDVYVMVMAENGYTVKNKDLEKLVERYAVDTNGDGKNIASIMNCPLKADNVSPSQETAYYTKFYGELQGGQTMLYISDDKADTVLLPGTIMYDLTKLYPDNPKVTKIGFRLTGDKLKEALGWDDMPQDSYIAIRDPAKVSGQTSEKAKKQFDESMKVIEGLIKDFS